MLYNSRENLRRVWEAVLKPPAGGVSEAEALSPRALAVVIGGGAIFMIWWLSATGVPVGPAALFLLLVYVIFLGLSRIVCQSGIFYVVPPMIAQNPVYHIFGRGLGRQGAVALGLTYSWHGDVQTQLAVLAAESMKVQERAPFSGRELTMAIGSVVVLGLIAAPLGIILLGYKMGAITFHTWLFQSWGPQTYGQVLNFVDNPQPFGFMRAVYLGAGVVGMTALTAAHRSLPWWPIHPIGLAAVSSFTMYAVYGTYFVVWIVKGAIMRWGGYKTVQRPGLSSWGWRWGTTSAGRSCSWGIPTLAGRWRNDGQKIPQDPLARRPRKCNNCLSTTDGSNLLSYRLSQSRTPVRGGDPSKETERWDEA